MAIRDWNSGQLAVFIAVAAVIEVLLAVATRMWEPEMIRFTGQAYWAQDVAYPLAWLLIVLTPIVAGVVAWRWFAARGK